VISKKAIDYLKQLVDRVESLRQNTLIGRKSTCYVCTVEDLALKMRDPIGVGEFFVLHPIGKCDTQSMNQSRLDLFVQLYMMKRHFKYDQSSLTTDRWSRHFVKTTITQPSLLGETAMSKNPV
jgi:hypothetical protein